MEHTFCQVPVCADAGIHEGILHIFLECPVAQRVTAWVCSLWAAVVGGRTPLAPRRCSSLGTGGRGIPGGADCASCEVLLGWLPSSSLPFFFFFGARHGSVAARPLRVLWWLPL